MAALNVIFLTFLEELFPDTVTAFTVQVPPGATIELSDA
jgi:hypothetical protein